MADDNLEIARRAFEEMRSRRYEGGVWDPGVEVINAEGWVIETAYHGHDGLRRWWDDLAEAFGEFAGTAGSCAPRATSASAGP